MKIILHSVFQKYADFLIIRLEKTDNQLEFDTLFNQALYLDTLASSFGIDLQ